MFAGPNGSGKTTVKNALQKPASWFGVYINPDDLEQEIRANGVLSLAPFEVSTSTEEVWSYFASSEFLSSQNLVAASDSITCRDEKLSFGNIDFNSYHASVLADFLRRKAMEAGKSFTFETVMSSRDKVLLLEEARERGFRTYLYFMATEDPEINIQRVKNRVANGGHDVPERKIIDRYHRSLALLTEALRHTNRAYLFDTSEDKPWFFAEITDNTAIELSGEIPRWFSPIWKQFDMESAESSSPPKP